MKKTIAFIVLGLLGVGLFTSMILSSNIHSLWDSLHHISIPALIVFTTISIINFLVFTVKWDVILRTNNNNIPPIHELALFRLVTFALSYLIPSAQVGGEPARIYLLEQKGVKRNVAVSSVVIDKVFELSINVLFSVGALAVLFLHRSTFENTGVFFIALAIIVLVFFFYQTVKGNGFFTSIFDGLRLNRIHFFAQYRHTISNTEKTMKTFFHHHLLALFTTIILSIICFLLMILEYFVIFYFLDVTPTFSQLLIVTVVPLMGYLIPVPGAVGTLEMAQITAFTLAGLDPILALPTVIILRVRDIIFVLGGLLYTYKKGFSLVMSGGVSKNKKVNKNAP